MWSWNILPRWLQRMTFFVGLPAWLALVVMIFTEAIFTMTLTMMIFAAFGTVGGLQTFFIARAVWRGEL